MNIHNKRGSEWRKWDLHIHSLYSNMNNNFNHITENEYINKIVNSELSVIGLTNYFNFKDTDFLLKKNLESRGITVFLNLELRLTYQNKDSDCCDIHIVFDNKLEESKIQQFLSNLNVIVNGNDKKAKSLTTTNDLQKGAVEFDKLLNTLNDKSLELKDKFLIGFLSRGKGNARTSSVYEKITQGANFIIHSTGNQQNIIEDSKFWLRYNKPLTQSSDAHSIEQIGVKYTWIKADTTFEGLKQIIYEPEERVKIQPNKPDEKRGYQVIDSVALSGDKFWNGTIYLNENLNTIIGGRSTGKSTLLKSIAKKISDRIQFDDEKEFIKNHLEGITVKWNDGEESIERDIDFFPQSYMHEIAKDQEKTSTLIKKIISNKDENKFLVEYEAKNNELKKSISKNLLNVFQLQSDIDSLQCQLKEKGDKKGVETEIQRLETKITELSKNSTISDVEIEQYKITLQKIADAELLVSQAENDLRLFSVMKNTTVINNSYPNEYGFDNLSLPLNRNELHRYFMNLKIETETKWIKIVKQLEKSTEEQKNIHINNIEQEKQTEIYKKYTKYYSDNKELNDIQSKIKEEKSRLQDIKGLEDKLTQLNSRKTETTTQIITDHQLYHSNAQSLVQNLKIEHDEVKITTKINYKKQEVKSFLENKLNQRGYDRQQYVSDFVNEYESDTIKTSREFLISALKNEIEYKNYNINQNVVTEFFITNWFNLSFELSYQNDIFDEMSQGKQAFVILKLLLDFSTKECPILIDQPEDSLDNRAIYNELVQYLRVKKKQRQIILVTHNPNVVVSADAENVIVANQEGKNSKNRDSIKFQYINGALENTKTKDDTNEIVIEAQGIREHVCEILEGGKEAFEKREQKYGFKR